MAVQLEQAVDYLRTLATASAGRDTDAELLHRYVQQRDQAAFATLVDRHGALVLNVCRRIVQHQEDAEDAFQATFLATSALEAVQEEPVFEWVAMRLSTDLASRVRRAASGP